jgi:hypothetical protein
MCPRDETSFYRHLGWRVADAPITCEQPGGRVTLAHDVAVVLPVSGRRALAERRDRCVRRPVVNSVDHLGSPAAHTLRCEYLELVVPPLHTTWLLSNPALEA